MPIVPRIDGWRVVIDLLQPKDRSVFGCSEYQARQVLRQVAEHQAMLMEAWGRFRG